LKKDVWVGGFAEKYYLVSVEEESEKE
jgi:hypothetical protein